MTKMFVGLFGKISRAIKEQWKEFDDKYPMFETNGCNNTAGIRKYKFVNACGNNVSIKIKHRCAFKNENKIIRVCYDIKVKTLGNVYEYDGYLHEVFKFLNR